VSLLLGYGKFNTQSIINTGLALKFYIGSVIGYTVVVLSANLLYSKKKNKVVATLYFLGTLFNIILAYLFSNTIGFQGIALAFSIANTALAVLFLIYIQIGLLKIFNLFFIINLLKAIIFMVSGAMIIYFNPLLDSPDIMDKTQNLKHLSISFISYILFGSIILYLLFAKQINPFVKTHILNNTKNSS
jgi:putative peptidoglycan lipid II flippase